MEDLIADYKLQIRELRSLVIILQKATQNDEQDFNKEIDDYLELTISKINNLLSNIDNLAKFIQG